MRNHFSDFHPGVIFIFYCAAIISVVILNNPLFLLAGILSALLLTAAEQGLLSCIKQIALAIPVVAAFALITAMFNHSGQTPFLYVNDAPLTVEALLYGVQTGVLVVSIILWFAAFHRTLGNDGFLFLFGRKFPQTALLITMIFRFIPYFRDKLHEITTAQKTLGISVSGGAIGRRMKNGSMLITALFSVTLEDTMETAVSMTARGYSLTGKTARGFRRVRRRDIAPAVISAACFVLFMLIWSRGDLEYYFFPFLSALSLTDGQALVLACYALFLNIPLVILITEELRWKFFMQKI
ncbi:MAG: energy-coupling factor transporter transmembrane component T [Oscillospiraceae bacterium]